MAKIPFPNPGGPEFKSHFLRAFVRMYIDNDQAHPEWEGIHVCKAERILQKLKYGDPQRIL